MAYKKVRIQQKFDTLENWNKNQLTLLSGELAVVVCDNSIRFKVGNGVSAFTELPFVDENQIQTKELIAQTISQGIGNSTSPYGIAGGAYLSTYSNFSQAFGVNAEVSSTDAFAFVWNGDDSGNIGEDPYQSHGKGTFSLNPINGLSGLYIGEQSLCAIINDENVYTRNQLCATSCYLSTEIESLSGYVDGLEVAIYGGDKNRDVIYMIPLFNFKNALNQINPKIGHALLSDDADLYDIRDNIFAVYDYYGITQPEVTTLSTLFRSLNDIILSTDLSSDYNFTIKKVLEQLNSDYCRLNLDQTVLSNHIDSISVQIPTLVSDLSNDMHYITREKSFQYHYSKLETSSATELSVAFDSIDLSNVYKKTETSSANELSTAFDSIDLSNVYKKWETSSDVELSSELSTKMDATQCQTIANQCIEAFKDKFDQISALSADSTVQEIASTLNQILAIMKANL